MTDATEADLLYGLEAIALHLSSSERTMTKRQVQHLHNTRGLPTFKVGATVCARRSAIARHFAELEAKGRAGE